jgi:hypothetical protein
LADRPPDLCHGGFQPARQRILRMVPEMSAHPEPTAQGASDRVGGWWYGSCTARRRGAEHPAYDNPAYDNPALSEGEA